MRGNVAEIFTQLSKEGIPLNASLRESLLAQGYDGIIVDVGTHGVEEQWVIAFRDASVKLVR